MRSVIYFFAFIPSLFAEAKTSLLTCEKRPTKNFHCEVQTKKPYLVNEVASWEIRLFDATGKESEHLQKNRFSFTKDKASFSVSALPRRYKLVSFICSENKGMCFREVIEHDL